jgi:hypothetical protein
MRTSRAGRLLGYRQRVTQATDRRMLGDEAGGPLGAGRDVGSQPSTVFALEAQRILARARARGASVQRTAGYLAVAQDTRIGPAVTQHSELRLDPTTYEAVAYVEDEEGRDVNGDAFTLRFSERVVSSRTLPDTPANRRLLELPRG